MAIGGRPPALRIHTPDGWTRIRTDAAHWKLDAERFLGSIDRRVRLSSSERTAVLDLLDGVVYAAQRNGTVLLMVHLSRDAHQRPFISSLTLTLTDLTPATASIDLLREAVDPPPGATTTEVDLPGGIGLLLQFAGTSSALPAGLTTWLAGEEMTVAQAYGPVPGTTWLAVGTCTVMRAEHADVAAGLATRLVHDLEPRASLPQDDIPSINNLGELR